MADKDFLNPDSQTGGMSGSDDYDSDLDNMVLNLEDVDEEGPGFEPLRPGIYDAVVENTEFGPSSNNNPMITWVFKVTDPEYEGRLLFFHTTLNNDFGVSRLKRILVRVLPEIDMAEFSPRQFCDRGEAIGYPCRVRVNIRPYQGQKRNNVTDVLPPSEGSFLDE